MTKWTVVQNVVRSYEDHISAIPSSTYYVSPLYSVWLHHW